MQKEEILDQKLARLQEDLRQMGRVAVAFSGGVDSTFLLKVAHDTLGDNAVAITARSCIFSRRESAESLDFCRAEGIRQILCPVDELQVEGFADNPPDRCYLCKRALFGTFCRMAEEQQLGRVVEGSNVDDCGDYRPGMRAIAELNIDSPLRRADLTKEEIRLLSRRMELPTWDKPSFACLASRFAYGETITAEKLAMVERAEELLQQLGFRQSRVRIHGMTARIEVLPEELERVMAGEVRTQIVETLRALGFLYVTLDMEGYRMGSMNEALKK